MLMHGNPNCTCIRMQMAHEFYKDCKHQASTIAGVESLGDVYFSLYFAPCKRRILNPRIVLLQSLGS